MADAIHAFFLLLNRRGARTARSNRFTGMKITTAVVEGLMLELNVPLGCIRQSSTKFEVAKEMKSLKTATVLLCFAVLAMPFGPSAKADGMDKKTIFAISAKAPNQRLLPEQACHASSRIAVAGGDSSASLNTCLSRRNWQIEVSIEDGKNA